MIAEGQGGRLGIDRGASVGDCEHLNEFENAEAPLHVTHAPEEIEQQRFVREIAAAVLAEWHEVTNRAIDILQQRVERDAKNRGNTSECDGRDAVQSDFIFLYLLERHTQTRCEFCLRNAACKAHGLDPGSDGHVRVADTASGGVRRLVMTLRASRGGEPKRLLVYLKDGFRPSASASRAIRRHVLG